MGAIIFGKVRKKRISIKAIIPIDGLRTGDAGDPGDANQAFPDFYLDGIAGAETVEIAAINGEAFDAVPSSPGSYDEAAGSDGAAHGEFPHNVSFDDLGAGSIRGGVGE